MLATTFYTIIAIRISTSLHEIARNRHFFAYKIKNDKYLNYYLTVRHVNQQIYLTHILSFSCIFLNHKFLSHPGMTSDQGRD